ncbi:hypothetical protein ACFVS7_27760 [Streptomyces rubiginosohelvolus]|uniref:hypothetical protein n=1 Tax=Streptomyces rubiginosohelvolus TaxID=67362 RepID=UPI0036DE0D69
MTADADPAPELKALLKALLRDTGLTQQSYARRCGLNPTHLSRLMNLHQVPQTAFLNQLIDAADRGPGGPVEQRVQQRADQLLLALVAQRHPERRYEEETRRRDHAEIQRRGEELQSQLDASATDLAAAKKQVEQLRTERRQLRADRTRLQQKLDVSHTTIRKLNQQLDALLTFPRSRQEIENAVRRRWEADASDRCGDLLTSSAITLRPLAALHLLVWLCTPPHANPEADAVGQTFLDDIMRCRSAADVSEIGTALLVDAVPGHPRQWAKHMLTALGRRRSLPELLAQRHDWIADRSIRWTGFYDSCWLAGWMSGDRALRERLAIFEPAVEETAPGIVRMAAEALHTGARPEDAAAMLLALARHEHPYLEAVAKVYFDPYSGPFTCPASVAPEFWRYLCRSYESPTAQSSIMQVACQVLGAQEMASILPWLHRWLWETCSDETVLDTFLEAVCTDPRTALAVQEQLRDGIDPGRSFVAERLRNLLSDSSSVGRLGPPEQCSIPNE